MSASVERELGDIRRMPYGTARIAAAEAITRRIEADGPKSQLAAALLDLVEAYTFADEGSKSFVVFARLLRLWDDSPELFDAADERNLFWEFKWIAGDLPDFPQITAAQAEAFFADMTRRFELAGHGLSSVRMTEFRWAWHTGRQDADAERLRWITGLRDDFEDCRACTIGQQVDFLTEERRYPEAIELALTQEDTCNLEPARTNYALALAALMDGKPDLALDAHRKAMATDDGSARGFAPARGQGFEALARGGRIDEALRILRNDHAELLRGGSTPLFQLRFLIGVLAGLSAAIEPADRPTGLRDPGMATVGELRDHVLELARSLAGPLDARNGNDRYAELVDAALGATLAEQPLPERAIEIGGGANTDGITPFATLSVVGTAPGQAHDAATAPPIVPGRSTADELLARAEHYAGRQDYARAVPSYTAAAESLKAAGWLARAGVALAEAAQSAMLAGEDASAQRLFAAAIPELRAGEAEPETIAAVLAAWAPAAARMNDPGEHLARTSEELERTGEFAADGVQEELAERLRAEWVARRASLRDTLARSIAAAEPSALPEGLDRSRAVFEALSAGQEYASIGLIGDASHAFWLAARLEREAGDTEDALWAYESAFEGFTLARLRGPRAEVAGEFIELLREAGRADRADEVTAQLLA
ncbi:hypothetical protein JD292_01990 [Leucobacter sp. CSA2]|uniref:Tetratricopeptide repeat protein n=1 Tax=Leucobacter edaphi TaxID=2796472 RepID=A0A934QAB6_9MICO|nr:hypothetical protein [Leucobacter edaphi]MBK0420851.1 hypothetical protein [Leucobacter edaphi]